MSVGLDTSVALRLLTGTPADQAEMARTLVATAPEPIGISDLVVSELYFALRHHYAVSHKDTVRAMHALLDDPRIRSSGVARAVFAADAAAGAKQKTGMMDRLIHADYQREGMALATFDRELALLPASRTFLAASPGQPTRAPDDFLRRPSSRDHSRSRAAVLLLRVDRQQSPHSLRSTLRD